MSIVNSEIREGVLLEQDYISIPVGLFEDLIRAETERDILEAALLGEHKYSASEVLEAILTARKKHLRGVMRIEIGVAPPAEPEPSDEDADAAADDEEDTDGTEACE